MVNFFVENEEILLQFATKAYNKWVRNTKLEEKEKLSLLLKSNTLLQELLSGSQPAANGTKRVRS